MEPMKKIWNVTMSLGTTRFQVEVTDDRVTKTEKGDLVGQYWPEFMALWSQHGWEFAIAEE